MWSVLVGLYILNTQQTGESMHYLGNSIEFRTCVLKRFGYHVRVWLETRGWNNAQGGKVNRQGSQIKVTPPTKTNPIMQISMLVFISLKRFETYDIVQFLATAGKNVWLYRLLRFLNQCIFSGSKAATTWRHNFSYTLRPFEMAAFTMKVSYDLCGQPSWNSVSAVSVFDFTVIRKYYTAFWSVIYYI